MINPETIAQLNHILDSLRDKAIDEQEALNKIVNLSFNSPYADQVQNAMDDQEIEFSNDVARVLRDAIQNEIDSDMTATLNDDLADLSYLKHHKHIDFARPNNVQAPIHVSDVQKIIEFIKDGLLTPENEED